MRQKGTWVIAAISMVWAAAIGCQSAPDKVADEAPPAATDSVSFRPECVFDDGLVLASQEDVYALAEHSCALIKGDLTITGADIKGLNPLDDLREVHGSLHIVKMGGLTHLEGFGKFERVTDDLIIENNPDLISIHALSTLVVLDGDMVVRGNEKLITLPSLPFFDGTIGKDLIVQDNPKLDSLDGLGSIQVVRGTVHLENLPISTLEGMELIHYVGGNFELVDLPGLTRLSVHGWSPRIEGDFVVRGRQGFLVNCEVSRVLSSNPTRVGGDIRIQHVASRVIIDSDRKLDDLMASECKSTNSSIYIVGTSAPDLIALDGLEEIGGDLVIRSNRFLSSLSGLEGLRIVGGDLVISHNPALRSTDQLDRLSEVGGQLRFEQLETLERLAGFDTLTHLGDGLHIAGNPALTDIDAFRQLHSVFGDVDIIRNPSLGNLRRIRPQSITGDLRLQRNASLSSLGSLRHTGKVLGRVTVRANGQIADDEVASLGE